MSQKQKKHEINQRQINFLQSFIYDKEYAISDFSTYKASKATLKRDIFTLVELGYLKTKGDFKSAKYYLSDYGLIHRPYDIKEYFELPESSKKIFLNFNFNIFKILSDNEIFTTEELELLNLYTNTFINNSNNLTDTIYKKELERFVIELSWKSSKIEGNTYSLLDTEKLIKDGIESIGHSREEAIMILNHKNAFNYIIENKNNVNNLLSRKNLEQIHYLLVKNLGVKYGLRKTGVGITGTFYKPISLVSQLEEQIEKFMNCLQHLSNPYAKALAALLCKSYLQPFEDGNKRTARLFANSILISAKLAPLSYRNVDEKVYKESLLIFYEQNSIEPFKKLFIEQYKFSCENYNIFKD